MSFEKFDKLCEKLITAEPASQQDILDERQKIIQQNAAVSALTFYGLAVTINGMLMECGARWCESFFGATVLFIPIAYIVFLILCAKNGALVGINGSPRLRLSACYWIGFGGLMAVFHLLRDDGGESFAVVRNGMLSEEFAIVLFFVFMVAAGAAALALMRKNAGAKDD